MLVLMVNSDPGISSRVRRMVAKRRGQLRLTSHEDFESAAREGKNENVAALVVPFDSPDRFCARILHWLWTWEGGAVPYLVSSKGSPGSRVMSSLAPSARAQAAPAGMQPSASEGAPLNWLPVKALPLESLIAIGHLLDRPGCKQLH